MTSLLATASAILTAISSVYSVFCVLAAIIYLRKRSSHLCSPNRFLPISILKPLKGTDPQMYESLRSHCTQQYPDYEIVFGVNAQDDPAVESVKAVQREFPDRPIRLVTCDRVTGSNRKISNLAELEKAARHEVFLVNDSDILVPPDYLSTVVAELDAPDIGLVTCLYYAVPGGGIWSRLESLGISTDFMPGVLVARELEHGLHFGLGSTLAFRKSDLQRIGGFEAIADFLADDYQLGTRIASLGLKVELSRTVVETFLPHYDNSSFISHQLRWARTIRSSRPGGYAGLPLTFTFFWALITLMASRVSPWAIGVFTIALVLRLAVAVLSARLVLRDRSFFRSAWLLPIRDLLAPLIWVAGLVGNRIVWRGQVFRLNRGKLYPA